MPPGRRGPAAVRPPELGALVATRLPVGDGGEVEIEGARIEDDGGTPLTARQLQIRDSELTGVTVAPGSLPGLWLRDVRLAGCDLSNVDARESTLQRVEISGSRLVGFGLGGASVRDLNVRDSVLMLGGFSTAKLRGVRFERVNLSEASFLEAQLEDVSFVDCRLEGADFRGVQLRRCEIRGSSLDAVIGLTSLRGITMPWEDVVGSAAAMAAALGIVVDGDD